MHTLLPALVRKSSRSKAQGFMNGVMLIVDLSQERNMMSSLDEKRTVSFSQISYNTIMLPKAFVSTLLFMMSLNLKKRRRVICQCTIYLTSPAKCSVDSSSKSTTNNCIAI